MNSAKIRILSLCFGLMLSACHQSENEKKPDTPKALGGGSVDFSSYRSSNILDELYKELLSKNPALKKLEDELVNIKSKTNEATKDFYNYDNKSSTYYNEAIYDACAIKDSTLQKKLLATLANSKSLYATKTTKLTAIIAQIADNNTQLNDRHIAIKIVLTLPLIEDFQTKNLPNTDGLKELITAQENLLKELKNLTPGY